MRSQKQFAAALAGLIAIVISPSATVAGKADVERAAAVQMKDGRYVVFATIRHADVDFDHFANRFEVIAPDGTILATRPLVHPHVDEQPFTRALINVSIPKDIKQITVRAHDKQHGNGGQEVIIKLPGRD